MPITLNGTTGIQTPLGSASAPSYGDTTTTNTGLYFPTSTTLGLSTAGTTAMVLNTSGDIGLGFTPTTTQLNTIQSTYGALTGNSQVNIAGNAYYNSGWKYVGTGLATQYLQSAGVHTWSTAVTGTAGGTISFAESMRIDASGNLLVGTTSQIQSGKISFVGTCSGQSSTASFSANQTGTSGDQFYFRTSSGATLAGYITCPTASTTSYVSVSDYRLKENVIPINNGLTTISALKPVKYDWLTDKAQGEGFIAHELAEFIPMAVTGEKDAVDADGNPIYQGVDYSKIVVHLVAALQELDAKFEAYKAAHP